MDPSTIGLSVTPPICSSDNISSLEVILLNASNLRFFVLYIIFWHLESLLGVIKRVQWTSSCRLMRNGSAEIWIMFIISCFINLKYVSSYHKSRKEHVLVSRYFFSSSYGVGRIFFGVGKSFTKLARPFALLDN